ncbi:bifunctional diguanylate cyclase/phosphodiesterase [Cupriavidus sp. DL-D2]|uniref:putative bifunctional diguanylate cyclase/phosphodiesterase n=1 Tax=Cupriavidus sp. DL-D2 TaxID=3144974 RepID=UPI0032154576
MIATNFSLLLLAALLGLMAAQGLRTVRQDGAPERKSARSLAWWAALMSQGTMGMPLWVAAASGTLTAANNGAKFAAAFAVTLVASMAASHMLAPTWLWLRGHGRGWQLAIATAMIAGAGLVAMAGARLGRVCGGTSMTPRDCIDAAGVQGPGWLAGGLALLCAGLYFMHRIQTNRWNAVQADGAGRDDFDEFPMPGRAGNAGGAGEARSSIRRNLGRFGGLTVRMSARDQRPVGEYSVSTELPDRTAFARWLDKSMAQSRLSDTSCAVLLIHIADFREVDEVFEVRADDILAQDAGALAQAALEPHHFLARLARDEFAVGVPELIQHSRAHELGDKVLGSLSEFVAARGLQMQIGVNIGIAISPRDATTSEALMQAARVSLSEARESGSNQMRMFNSAAGERARRMRVIRRDLWPAIQDDALSLVYQPKYDVKTRSVIGAEALCRWRHPTLGAVNPAEFIMVAEQSGQIDKLDDWVISQVCRQVRMWHDAGLPPAPVAINVSGLRFASRNFPQYLLEQIHQHDIPPSAITLEITETAAMKDIAKSLETLTELQSLGIHVALDDFGSGYSSLGYLKRLRVGTLKIDRTLIGGLDADPQGRAIVGSMVALAHELRMKVVAEGVESASQLDILDAMGCDEVQGYLMAMPLEASVFADLLQGARTARI